MKKYLAMILSIILTSPAFANVIYLDFEGIESYPHDSSAFVAEYYNGGAATNGQIGPNLGVSFGPFAGLLCLNTAGVTCTNLSRGGFGTPASRLNAVGFFTNDIINVPGGFDTGLSFVYSNPIQDSSELLLYADVNATGNLIGRIRLPITPTGRCDPQISGGADFCPFFGVSFAFDGIVRSIRANAENVAFDDFTFGSARAAGIPEPASWAMMIAGFGFVGAAARRRRSKRDAVVSWDN
jgi:PEP-CTERM motif